MNKYIFMLCLVLAGNAAIADPRNEQLNGTWGAKGWVPNQQMEKENMNNNLGRNLCLSSVGMLGKVLLDGDGKPKKLSNDELKKAKDIAGSIDVKYCPEYAEVVNALMR
jgi:hypothetical protein